MSSGGETSTTDHPERSITTAGGSSLVLAAVALLLLLLPLLLLRALSFERVPAIAAIVGNTRAIPLLSVMLFSARGPASPYR